MATHMIHHVQYDMCGCGQSTIRGLTCCMMSQAIGEWRYNVGSATTRSGKRRAEYQDCWESQISTYFTNMLHRVCFALGSPLFVHVRAKMCLPARTSTLGAKCPSTKVVSLFQTVLLRFEEFDQSQCSLVSLTVPASPQSPATKMCLLKYSAKNSIGIRMPIPSVVHWSAHLGPSRLLCLLLQKHPKCFRRSNLKSRTLI